MQKRQVYLNKAQQYIYNICARDMRALCARRFGKTDGVLGPHLVRVTQSMPRGAGIWLGNSRKQLFTRTVPATLAAIERMFGYKDGVHFWWGRPPSKLNIPKPIITPKDWSHCISFYNGFVWHLVSLEVRGSANSMTVNCILADESRFLRKDKIDSEVMPTLSGINDPLGHPGFSLDNPLYKSTLFVSDAALSQRESWMEKEESKVTIDKLKELNDMIAQLKKVPQLLQVPGFVAALQKLRGECFAFFKFSTLDNIDILGESYIAKMKRDLPPVIFAISILNMPKRQSSDGFYSNLNIDDLHGYAPTECPAYENSIQKKIGMNINNGQKTKTDYESPDFNFLNNTQDCTLDGDVMPFLPLSIAFDYNANINWVVTGQVYNFEGTESLMTLSSLYVKNERKLRQLCEDWCKYYAPHRKTNNKVTYYYDATAKQGSYAVADVETFWQVVVSELTKKGWDVTAIDMGRPMEHRLKHKEINEAFCGVSAPYPRFNTDNNESLIIAMENTKVRVGSKGFEKDKSKEKYVETEFDPLELRTDGTDAWDTLFLGVKFFKSNLGGVRAPRRG